VKVDPKLGGQRKEKEKEKVLCLVANRRRGRFFYLVANGGKKRRFFCFVANGRRRFFVWWPIKGEGEGSFVWWPMEGEGEGFFVWWPIKGEGEGSFSLLPTFPPNNFTWTFVFFPLTLRFYFTMVLGHYLRIPSLFLGL
jgi:hypothetical protein